ncbi:MAG: hypothetical protein HY675_20795 [Chloroflexi bacterium]|nr:hypothetical protein [Chloroflexota bacterium]
MGLFRHTRHIIPIMGILLIVVSLLTLSAQSVFSGSTTFSEYGGDLIDTTQEVSLGTTGIQKAGSAVTAAGTTVGAAVTLASGGTIPLSTTAIAKGNWFYRLQLDAVAGTTPASTAFKVELYRWSSTTNDYTLLSTLYVASDATPAAGERARLYFDLGAVSPSPSEGFSILVTRA